MGEVSDIRSDTGPDIVCIQGGVQQASMSMGADGE